MTVHIVRTVDAHANACIVNAYIIRVAFDNAHIVSYSFFVPFRVVIVFPIYVANPLSYRMTIGKSIH